MQDLETDAEEPWIEGKRTRKMHQCRALIICDTLVEFDHVRVRTGINGRVIRRLMASINVNLRGGLSFSPLERPSYLIILILANAAFEANKCSYFTYRQCVGHSLVFPRGRSQRSSLPFQLIGPVSDVMFRNLNFRILLRQSAFSTSISGSM